MNRKELVDALATQTYAKAYNQSPESVSFYEFTKSMELYKSAVGKDTTLVLSTGSEAFRYLQQMNPPPPAAANQVPQNVR